MKKILIAMLAILPVISCNKDDDQSITPEVLILPKSGTDSNEDGTVTSKYEYDGNKLKRITWTDAAYEDHEEYIYENNRLTQTNFYWDNDLVEKKTFIYSGDKLTSVIKNDYVEMWGEVREYSYNSSTSITVKEYSRDLDEGEDSELFFSSTVELTLNDGNITKSVRTYDYGVVETYVYAFDSKHSPLSNVLGANILILAELEGGRNNYVNLSLSTPEASGTVTYTNTYNTEGYLLQNAGSNGTSASFAY